MGFPIYCNLNSPPSTLVSSDVACVPRRRESLKKQFLLGLTCAIIGLEFPVVGDQERVIAMDAQSGPPELIKAQRWSDKRACKPWRVNSLETIVPENLPRPSARRRWEATGFGEVAPPLKVVGKSVTKGCFNM